MALSGGMAQRLMVARAIMHRPQILFLDEPTAGLDPQSRIALWEIVDELHREGETILLTTHYMEEADQLCDRVAIMDHGRILALDTPERPEAVHRRRQHRHSHRRRGRPRAPRPPPRRRDRRAPPTARVVDGAVLLSAQRHRPAAADRRPPPSRSTSTVTDLSVSEPTLETVFINLTGKDLRE